MLEFAQRFFFDKYSVGDTTTIRLQLQKERFWLGVSEDGASVRMNVVDGVEFEKGQCVRAQIVDKDARYRQFVCDFVAESEWSFSISEAFRRYIHFMAVDLPFEGQEEIIAEPMPEEYVREIIGMLDRKAVLSKKRYVTYNYLALAALLAKMLDDKSMVEYYEKRKALVEMFDEYENVDRIDSHKFDEILSNPDQDLLYADMVINEDVTKYKILDVLKNRKNINELFQIRKDAETETIRNAADLAISLLLSSRFKLPEVAKQLSDRLHQELGVKATLSKEKNYGVESQTCEFKTSAVFPADYQMKAAPKIQGIEITKVVCSFLNSDSGGILYIGVDDCGVACGVANDLTELGCSEDAYDRYVRGIIKNNLGVLANQCVVSEWETTDGYRVYVLKIRPCPRLVDYNGYYWIRQGTEKRIVPEKELKDIETLHAKALEKYQQDKGTEGAFSEAPDVNVQNDSSNIEVIATSTWRGNIVHNYEEGYGVDVAAYIHFLPQNKFKITQEETFEDVCLSLAVLNEETDGYLVVAYESGNLLVVAMEALLNMNRKQFYARCKDDMPVFACPAMKDDCIMTVWKNTKDVVYARIDKIDTLEAKHCGGNMTDCGAKIVEAKFNQFVMCEIVKGKYDANLKLFRNQQDGLGQKMANIKAADRKFLKEEIRMDVDKLI